MSVAALYIALYLLMGVTFFLEVWKNEVSGGATKLSKWKLILTWSILLFSPSFQTR